MIEEAKDIIKTSIRITRTLWRDVKVFAAQEGLKITQIIEEALKEYLEKRKK